MYKIYLRNNERTGADLQLFKIVSKYPTSFFARLEEGDAILTSEGSAISHKFGIYEVTVDEGYLKMELRDDLR